LWSRVSITTKVAKSPAATKKGKPNTHHEGREEHEGKSMDHKEERVLLRDLRALRGESKGQFYLAGVSNRRRWVIEIRFNHRREIEQIDSGYAGV
jgi:hypothetical protein